MGHIDQMWGDAEDDADARICADACMFVSTGETKTTAVG